MWNFISVNWPFIMKQSNFSTYELLILTITLGTAGQAPASLSCITCAAQICFSDMAPGCFLTRSSQRASKKKRLGSSSSSCHMSQPQWKCCITSLNSWTEPSVCPQLACALLWLARTMGRESQCNLQIPEEKKNLIKKNDVCFHQRVPLLWSLLLFLFSFPFFSFLFY